MIREESVHLLLSALFHWHLTVEQSGLPPINLLHRISTEGHVIREGRPGHRILCPEMSRDLRRVQAAFNKLDLPTRIVVVTKHMPPPLNEDGAPMFKAWGDREKAQYLNEPTRVFKNHYRRAVRKIKRNY